MLKLLPPKHLRLGRLCFFYGIRAVAGFEIRFGRRICTAPQLQRFVDGNRKDAQNGLNPEKAGFGHKKGLVTTDATRPFKLEGKGVEPDTGNYLEGCDVLVAARSEIPLDSDRSLGVLIGYSGYFFSDLR